MSQGWCTFRMPRPGQSAVLGGALPLAFLASSRLKCLLHDTSRKIVCMVLSFRWNSEKKQLYEPRRGGDDC